MKAKYRKEKQTDSSAPLSILTMSISLSLSPDRERSQLLAIDWLDSLMLSKLEGLDVNI